MREERFTYDKLVILGHCVSGKRLIESLLRYYPKLVDMTYINALGSNWKMTDDIIKFISTKKKNKILVSQCQCPWMLFKLEPFIFKRWKFIKVNRKATEAISSGILVANVQWEHALEWGNDQIISQDLFYEKIILRYSRSIVTNFDDIFNNTQNTIEMIFKFLELDVPKKSLIDYEKSREKTIKFMENNKCKIGQEIHVLDNKNDVIAKMKELKMI